jgi:hypothetical protein
MNKAAKIMAAKAKWRQWRRKRKANESVKMKALAGIVIAARHGINKTSAWRGNSAAAAGEKRKSESGVSGVMAKKISAKWRANGMVANRNGVKICEEKMAK